MAWRDGPSASIEGGRLKDDYAIGVIARTEGPRPLALLPRGDRPIDGELVWCHVPRPLPGAEPGETPLVVGDQVRVRPRVIDAHEILAREPRRTALSRGEPGRAKVQTIVANIDQIVVVVALRRPEPSRYRLDRLLVLARQNDIPAIVCLNKIDLVADTVEIERFLNDYRLAGYDVLATSVKLPHGLTAFHDRLRGATTALVGESGVGKSSLLNAIYPGLNLRVGEVSAVGRGSHTTTAARLLPTTDGQIVDTPGVQFLLPADIESTEVGDYFPEIYDRAANCRFPNCSHTREIDCAVIAAVERGEFAEARWQSYVELYRDLEAAAKVKYARVRR